jgi:hypothetical protein
LHVGLIGIPGLEEHTDDTKDRQNDRKDGQSTDGTVKHIAEETENGWRRRELKSPGEPVSEPVVEVAPVVEVSWSSHSL